MALGETLANLRKRKGLSQEQLAEELNLTRQTISKWELNQSTPDIDYILQLSEFFQVSTDYLIKGKDVRINQIDEEMKSTSKDEQISNTKQKSNIAYKWCFYLGITFISISFIGMIVFVVCAALHPWTAVVDDMVFTGLLGFLIGTNTLWCFVILLLFFVLGFSISVWGIIKRRTIK